MSKDGTREQAGMAPDAVTYNTLISVCDKAKQPKEAAAMFSAMEAAGLRADVITYSTLISCYEKGGEWEAATQLMHTMRINGVVRVDRFRSGLFSCEQSA